MNNRFPTKGVLDASHKGAWEQVGGIPLVARNLYHLIELNIKNIIILMPKGKRIDHNLDKWRGDAKVTYIYLEKDPLEYLSGINEDFIYLNASYLFDKRIIEKIISSVPITIFLGDITLKEVKTIPIGLFNEEGIRAWREKGLHALLDKSNIIYLQDIDPFSMEMRGKIPPYMLYVKDKEDAIRATWTIIKNMQKKVMDLPAEYIDPFFENHLTYLLCRTRITPNMVTLFSLFVAIIIAFFFYNGHFVLGAFCTYIVEVLDGVDGKLARTRLQFTRFGEYECLVDYFYENLWYIAIGMGLKRTYHYDSAILFAGIMVVSDTIDNILYTLCNKWTGKNLDLLWPFNMAFRKIAGRRNIYCFMFMIGFLSGYYLQTFMLTSIWALITIVVHAITLGYYIRKSK